MEMEKRLRRLEKANRVQFILLALMGAYISIGYVNAATQPKKIVADSIVTHELAVVDEVGPSRITMSVSKDGGNTLAFVDTKGDQTMSLGLLATGQPDICLADDYTCRITLGESFRDNNKRELNIELRDRNGKTIWMPETRNPLSMRDLRENYP